MDNVIEVKPHRAKVICAGKNTSSIGLSELTEIFSVVNGKVFLQYKLNKNEILFIFQDGVNFLYRAKKDVIEWSFFGGSMDSIANDREGFIFKYEGGIQERCRCNEILSSLTGRKLVFYPSKNLLFFHSQDRNEYVIGSFINIDNSDDVYINISES